MQLAALIALDGIDPKQVAVMFHISDQPALHRALPILERVSPDLEAAEVIGLEQNWKRRLDTVAHGLNRN